MTPSVKPFRIMVDGELHSFGVMFPDEYVVGRLPNPTPHVVGADSMERYRASLPEDHKLEWIDNG